MNILKKFRRKRRSNFGPTPTFVIHTKNNFWGRGWHIIKSPTIKPVKKKRKFLGF